ncbi:MAG TPA: secretin N-terminal domain-containing protein, partial [Phycisphaerae bacterium]|nr:secretin N-terminal domain-containing protein [Phycisphaerae bacterium]
EIDVEGLEAKKDDELITTLKPSRSEPRDVTPCVLPAALLDAADAITASAIAQAADSGATDINTSGVSTQLNDAMRSRLQQEAQKEPQPSAQAAQPSTATPQPAPAASPAPVTTPAPAATPAPSGESASTPQASSKKPKVKISIDRRNNTIRIMGEPGDVEAVKDKLDEILEDMEEAPSGAPDIRVWQLDYVDPNVASQVLESMFGASSPRTQAANAAAAMRAQQLAAARALQQAQAAARRGQQGNQAGGEDGKGGNDRGGRGERGKEEEQPQAQGPQQQGGISVFPYPALRAIIIKAPTEMYPAIEELVATIDRPTPTGTEFEFFHIHSQAASDVEAQLKVIFNIDQTQQQKGRATPRGRNPQAAAAMNVEQLMANQFDLAALGDEAATLGSTSSITITSNDETNTVLVRGPRPVLDLAKEIIAEIEKNAPPEIETRTYPLEYADAAKVVPQLKELFPPGKPDTWHPDRVQATFLANALNNEVVVQARVTDFDRIQKVIERLDTQPADGEKAITVAISCGDAEKFAKLLGNIYGMGRGAESGKKVEFVGDAASNTVVFTAPKELREEITKRIDSLDATACDLLEPHFITLENGSASQIAKVIEEAFNGGRGGVKRVRVAGDDSTRKLIVSSPADIYPQIEAFAKTLDVPPTDLDVKTYTLKYAKASETLQQMEQMFRTLGQQLMKLGQPVDAFAGTASDRANTITVAGGPMTFTAVEKFLADVDTVAQDTTVGTMVVALNKTDANEVANMIRRLFPRAENGVEPPRAEANDRTNTLVVIGTQAQRDRIQNEVINKLEEIAGPQQERDTRVYPITYAGLNDVRNAISTAFRLERGANESQRVDVAVENSTGSVIITALPDKLDKVAALIKDIDKDSGTSTLVRHTYDMKQGKASQVADVINRTIRETRRGNQGPPVSVVANDDLNVVVVTSTDKDYAELEPLIEKLDQPPAEGELVIKVYPVEYADPGSLIQTINNSFPRLHGQRPEDTVRASYTWGTSSLVVAASEKNHERVARILADIDVASSQARTTHVIALKEANAEELARRLTDILNRTQRRRRDDTGMAVVADPGTNSLLVFASESELKEVQELINTLDQPTSFQPEIRSFKLNYAEAWPTREAIVQLFGTARGRRLTPQEEVSVVVDWGSNSVVVSASKSKMADIEKFITQIDQSGQGSREVHVVRLEQADAAGVVRSLQEMFVQRNTRGQETISISNPQGSDALLIKANDKEFAQIEPVIKTLDTMPDDKNRVARMFTLKYTDPEEMQAIVEDYLSRPGNNRGRRGSASDLVGDVRITTMPTSNSIVATGNAEAVDRVAALVERIDVEVEGAGNAPRIIHLDKAIASDIEPALTQLFVEGGNTRGRNRRGSSSQMTPVIVANDYANTLIVRASPADFAAIENLVQSLDQEASDPSKRFEIVQVASAFRVADLAPTIQDTVAQASRSPGANTGRSGRGGQRQTELTVQPIEASNTLILAGDRKQIEVAKAMIDQIQKMGPEGGMTTKIIPIGKRDPEEIKRVIDEMINNNKSQGSSSRSRRGRRR